MGGSTTNQFFKARHQPETTKLLEVAGYQNCIFKVYTLSGNDSDISHRKGKMD